MGRGFLQQKRGCCTHRFCISLPAALGGIWVEHTLPWPEQARAIIGATGVAAEGPLQLSEPRGGLPCPLPPLLVPLPHPLVSL